MALALVGALGGCKLSDPQPTAAVINTRDVITKCNEGIQVVTEVQKQFADRQALLKAQEEAIGKLRQDPAAADPASPKGKELQAQVPFWPPYGSKDGQKMDKTPFRKNSAWSQFSL